MMQYNVKKGVDSLKKLLFTFITMLTILLSCTIFAEASQYSKIKVGLYYGSNAKNSVSIHFDHGFSYGYFDGENHIEQGRLTGTDFTFRAITSTKIVINEVQVFDTQGINMSIVPVGGNITLDGTEYRGSIVLTNISDSKMMVMNVLHLEEYLWGVVPGEMPSSWDHQALKAQAVCARGFAVSNFNKHISSGFNVCATTNCQVYKGASAETEATTKAVNETYGKVVTFNGEPIESLFFSSSGGYTANAKNVWGGYVEYLQGVPDPYEPADAPNHSWNVYMSLSEIKTALANYGVNVGTVWGFQLTEDETGRVYKLRIDGSEGSKTLTYGSTCAPFVPYGVISPNYDAIACYDPATGLLIGYHFYGGGWGHGVGLSQYGAKGMADAGFYYRDILKHYYPGTEIGTIY